MENKETPVMSNFGESHQLVYKSRRSPLDYQSSGRFTTLTTVSLTNLLFSNNISATMEFSVTTVFVVFYSLFAISHSAPAVCSSAAPPPQNRLDVILAEKLSAVSDKSTIPDFDSALQLNTQTTHLPCPDSEHDPRRFSSPAFNIKSVIPW